MTHLTKWAFIFAVMMFATLGSLMTFYYNAYDKATERAERAESEASGLREAQRGLERQLHFLEEERARWEAVIEELGQLEGANEPLNDYGRAVLERVRAARP